MGRIQGQGGEHEVQVWGGVRLAMPYPDCIIRDREKRSRYNIIKQAPAFVGNGLCICAAEASTGMAYVPDIMLCYSHVLLYLILTAKSHC